MKSQLKPLVALLCIAGLTGSAFAVTSTSSTQPSKTKQTVVKTDGHRHKNGTKAVKLKNEASRPVLTGQQLYQLIREEREFLPFDLDVPGQAFVSTGPYIGVPLQFAGMNLVVNTPSVNNDLQLLNIRKNILTELRAMHSDLVQEPYHSHLLFSGLVEGGAGWLKRGGLPSTTDIDLSSVSIDAFMLGPSDWTLGFLELSYENTSPLFSPYGSTPVNNYTVSNSRVFINKGFITVGDLAKSPFYGTLGRYYVPFGVYSSVMVSSPLTKTLTRTKAKSLLIGYDHQGNNALFASVYAFNGDTIPGTISRIDNGGINLGYRFMDGLLHGRFGGGVIASIADSEGMQDGNGFRSFENIAHRVPGYNAHANIGIGEHIDLIGEYVGASTTFNSNDMSYNGHGAKPSAFDFEGAYTFTIFGDRPSAFGIGYSKSNEALSIGLPLKRYYAAVNTSIWRNTLQAIEIRHDQNYAASDSGNGPTGAAATPGACTAFACTATGKGDNAITASFDYYF